MIARLHANAWLSASYFALAVLCCPISAADTFEYTKRAELDAEGNIFVSSDEGKPIRMAGPNHCSVVTVAPDKQTVGCTVTRSLQQEEFSQPLRLEIYLKGGQKRTIELGAPIHEWHFWKDGRRVAVSWGALNSPVTHGLYDITTARMIEEMTEPSDGSWLPQWAKNQLQIQNESVPSSPALTEERTKWIAKILSDIGKIKPGMRRKDLSKIFTTEGGFGDHRYQRRYVHLECSFIKVKVRFKAADNDRDELNENPEDVIESIAQPYLEWAIVD